MSRDSTPSFSAPSQMPLTEAGVVVNVSGSESTMADSIDFRQDAALAGATSVQSATSPPPALCPSPSSIEPLLESAPAEQRPYPKDGDGLGLHYTSNSTIFPPYHQYQTHCQQLHPRFIDAPPLSSPDYHHNFQHHYRVYSQQEEHPYYYPQSRVQGYHQYPAPGEDHDHSLPTPGHRIEGDYNHIHVSPFPLKAEDEQFPLYGSTCMPPDAAYHAPHHPNSLQQASGMQNKRRPTHQLSATSNSGYRKQDMRHPYHQQYQQYQQTQPHQSPVLPTVPPSPLIDKVGPLKGSTIFAPDAKIITDGSAPNYGRLPDGKIIELYPAMMRATQACELCRKRKAKCSGAMPCERCAKGKVACEYVRLDRKKRFRTTTSEYDVSDAAGKKSGTNSESKTGSAVSEEQRKGGSSSATATATTTASKAKSVVAVTKPTRKSTRIHSGMLAHASLSATPRFDDVSIDLATSPFPTPVTLLSQRGMEQNYLTPNAPTSSSFAQSPTTLSFAAVSEYQSSPASTASYASTEASSSGPAPDTMFSPLPTLSQEAVGAWAHEGVPVTPVPLHTAFRHGHHPFRQTCFY